MENKNMIDAQSENFATEMYRDLKRHDQFKNKIIYCLLAIIALLVLCMTAMSIYHEYLWGQFDTIEIDAGEGYANYVGGENTGGIYNGTDKSEAAP